VVGDIADANVFCPNSLPQSGKMGVFGSQRQAEYWAIKALTPWVFSCFPI